MPRRPSAFDACLAIARRGIPFTALGGRAFITVPAQSVGGCHTLPIRSPAFRHWFYRQFLAACDTVPAAHAFHHLEAQAAADPDTTHLRVDSRGPTSRPRRILLDLANRHGHFVEITPTGESVRDRTIRLFASQNPSPASQPKPNQ